MKFESGAQFWNKDTMSIGIPDRWWSARRRNRWLGLAALSALAARAQIPAPTDAPQPLAPEQSAAAFRLPEGFRLEVVASEPLIASPSGVCWDERGRMFVSELHGYNLAG